VQCVRFLCCCVPGIPPIPSHSPTDIVTESGYIRKTYDNVVDGVTIADLLHDCLLNPESDHADVFSDEEKQEFLYQLFKMVVTGGSMCQFDDNWQPYLDTVKVSRPLGLCGPHSTPCACFASPTDDVQAVAVGGKEREWQAEHPVHRVPCDCNRRGYCIVPQRSATQLLFCYCGSVETDGVRVVQRVCAVLVR
jgi:hypothetical protein